VERSGGVGGPEVFPQAFDCQPTDEPGLKQGRKDGVKRADVAHRPEQRQDGIGIEGVKNRRNQQVQDQIGH